MQTVNELMKSVPYKSWFLFSIWAHWCVFSLVLQYAKLAISLKVPGGGKKKPTAAAASGDSGVSAAAAAPEEEEDEYAGGLC